MKYTKFITIIFVIVLLSVVSKVQIAYGNSDYEKQTTYYMIPADSLNSKLSDVEKEELRMMVLGLFKGEEYKNVLKKLIDSWKKQGTLIKHYETEIDKLNFELLRKPEVVKEVNWFYMSLGMVGVLLINWAVYLIITNTTK